MEERPSDALGLIYPTCQGQDPPKRGNTLTPPPGAYLVFNSLRISLHNQAQQKLKTEALDGHFHLDLVLEQSFLSVRVSKERKKLNKYNTSCDKKQLGAI